MTAEQYIEKYINLIELENWEVFWEGNWYWLSNKETERLLTLLDLIGISKESSYEVRKAQYEYWLQSLLKVCPHNKDVAQLLYGDMRNHFGLNDDEIYDLFIQEIEKQSDRLYLDDEDQVIRKKVIR